MQNDWNNSTESERVAELQHLCPNLYRDLAKLEFSDLPESVQIALVPPTVRRTYGSFYECLNRRDEILRSGGGVTGISKTGTSFYFDWSPANG